MVLGFEKINGAFWLLSFFVFLFFSPFDQISGMMGFFFFFFWISFFFLGICLNLWLIPETSWIKLGVWVQTRFFGSIYIAPISSKHNKQKNVVLEIINGLLSKLAYSLYKTVIVENAKGGGVSSLTIVRVVHRDALWIHI